MSLTCESRDSSSPRTQENRTKSTTRSPRLLHPRDPLSRRRPRARRTSVSGGPHNRRVPKPVVFSVFYSFPPRFLSSNVPKRVWAGDPFFHTFCTRRVTFNRQTLKPLNVCLKRCYGWSVYSFENASNDLFSSFVRQHHIRLKNVHSSPALGRSKCHESIHNERTTCMHEMSSGIAGAHVGRLYCRVLVRDRNDYRSFA